eukprot:scaffold37363_cov298-Isochrysis_galbana.AAC.2
MAGGAGWGRGELCAAHLVLLRQHLYLQRSPRAFRLDGRLCARLAPMCALDLAVRRFELGA